MNQLLISLTFLASILLLLFNAPLLDLIGWKYTSAGGVFLMKIHPAFYLLMMTAPLALITGEKGALQAIKKPSIIFFTLATLLLLGKATTITISGVNEGELSTIIVTFLIPALLLICLPILPSEKLNAAIPALRIFFIFNSLMAIAERALGMRFIPSFLDAFTSQDRSSALLGHPLNAALLTGIMIVYLMSNAKRTKRSPAGWAELGLHVIAMFAFGGRSALVFTAVVLIMSSLSLRTNRGFSAGRRMLPIMVMLAGLGLVFLPIDFIDATLDRFTNDKGSADTRNAAFQLLSMVSTSDLLHGIPATQRQIFMTFLKTPAGFEVSWIALIISYGLLITIPMMFALPLMLFSTSRGKDRSAFYIAILFIIVTIGSLSIGSKSLLLGQTLIMMAVLTTPARRLGGRAFASPQGLPIRWKERNIDDNKHSAL